MKLFVSYTLCITQKQVSDRWCKALPRNALQEAHHTYGQALGPLRLASAVRLHQRLELEF